MGEHRVSLEHVPRKPDQVGRARVVARIVEPDRGRVVRVVETELDRARVHHRHEPRDRPLADVVRQVQGGVVGARDERRHQQVVDAHPLARRESDLRSIRREVLAGVRERPGQRLPLERHQGGHQLGGAGDRHRGVGVHPVQPLTGPPGDEDGGTSAQRWWRDGVSGRPRRRGRASGDDRDGHGQRDRDRRQDLYPAAPAHRRSLSRWPVWRLFGSSDGLSCSRVRTGIPVLEAMVVKLSPGWTV